MTLGAQASSYVSNESHSKPTAIEVYFSGLPTIVVAPMTLIDLNVVAQIPYIEHLARVLSTFQTTACCLRTFF